jgi:N-acyl-D-aspartate/D-glutamate deacylase
LTATELSKQFNNQFCAYQTKIDASSIAQETFNDDMKSAILTQQSNFTKQQHSMDEMSHNFTMLNTAIQDRFQKLFADMQEMKNQFQMTLGNSPNNNRYDESSLARRITI